MGRDCEPADILSGCCDAYERCIGWIVVVVGRFDRLAQLSREAHAAIDRADRSGHRRDRDTAVAAAMQATALSQLLVRTIVTYRVDDAGKVRPCLSE